MKIWVFVFSNRATGHIRSSSFQVRLLYTLRTFEATLFPLKLCFPLSVSILFVCLQWHFFNKVTLRNAYK
jgi:hypothetical protein